MFPDTVNNKHDGFQPLNNYQVAISTFRSYTSVKKKKKKVKRLCFKIQLIIHIADSNQSAIAKYQYLHCTPIHLSTKQQTNKTKQTNKKREKERGKKSLRPNRKKYEEDI